MLRRAPCGWKRARMAQIRAKISGDLLFGLPHGTLERMETIETSQATEARSDVPGPHFLPPASPSRTPGRRRLTAAVAGLALVVLPLAAWLALRAGTEKLPDGSEEANAVRRVRVVHPGRVECATLTLPANIDAFQTTLIYSRVSGYLLKWYVDIGQEVPQGHRLADIDTPELDQELAQARANLVQGKAEVESARAELNQAQAGLNLADAEIARAKANLEYARSARRRAESLSPLNAISELDLDESRRDAEARQADLDSANAQRRTREAAVATAAARIKSRQATVDSLDADVRRLEELQGFKTITAPFAGVVTRRRAEVGILVTAGSTASSPELFAIAQTDSLRIKINVPQSLAGSIHTGQKAQVQVPEYPEREFAAAVARTSQAIDPKSRTLMVELELANADRALLPGTFAQVVLPVRRTSALCTIPTGALLNRPDGLRVAVVTPGDSIRLQPVKLGRDYGSTAEVLVGISGNERLVLNPPDDLAENERVSVADSGEGDALPAASQAGQPAVRKGGA